ncbi:ricin B-like lectin R40G3 [Magnolia sinica]|uniref:ricin B-like lectin R40G3 n=1 Tax=Magnolia sinica TaxID=86752 RepID=UPI00265A049A|nr:ricin B-like lectin R40G3 [Magnolia sinica]
MATVRVSCRGKKDYSLSVRDGMVVLAKADPTDELQHWIKDLKYSTRVKDASGLPSFSLINKATGLALKHSIGDTLPAQLSPHNPYVLDQSILWTEYGAGDGFNAIRMVNNIALNLDAFNEVSGPSHDSTIVGIWKWSGGDNQKWKIDPY